MVTKITFPAMRGSQGGREYYTCNVHMSDIPRLFTTINTADTPVEERAQRVLTVSRVPKIRNYMLEATEGYVIPPIIASYRTGVEYKPCAETNEMGILEFNLDENTLFNTNDGQHRVEGIKAAVMANPELARDTISIVFFRFESIEREQQMFVDLNMNMVKTSRALNIVFNANDALGRALKAAVKKVPVFCDLVDMERTVIPEKSNKLFTLLALYNATTDFKAVADSRKQWPVNFDDQVSLIVDFWNAVSVRIKAWSKVANGTMTAQELRAVSISAHAVILQAIGYTGGLLRFSTEKWKKELAPLASINWNKQIVFKNGKNEAKSNPLWLNKVIVANSVLTNRDAKLAAKGILMKELGIKAEPLEKDASEPRAALRARRPVKALSASAPKRKAKVLADAA